MTQFETPAYPPPPAYSARTSPPPWSAAAIAAFVLSLLGFLGVTAVLGIILGIVGCVTASGGRRRGMGLAIASIPISLVTGVISLLLLFAFLFAARMAQVPRKLNSVFAATTDVSRAAGTLRQLATDDWNKSVSDDALQVWLGAVQGKYGALTSATVDMAQTMSASERGEPAVVLNGKFVNATAVIRIRFDPQEIWNARISDVEIDGTSPAKASPGEAPAAAP